MWKVVNRQYVIRTKRRESVRSLMVARWELEKGEVEIRCVPFFLPRQM